jgi:hypothetical protein
MSSGVWQSATHRRCNPIVHTCSFRKFDLS